MGLEPLGERYVRAVPPFRLDRDAPAVLAILGTVSGARAGCVKMVLDEVERGERRLRYFLHPGLFSVDAEECDFVILVSISQDGGVGRVQELVDSSVWE